MDEHIQQMYGGNFVGGPYSMIEMAMFQEPTDYQLDLHALSMLSKEKCERVLELDDTKLA
jgi:hypothetical protein